MLACCLPTPELLQDQLMLVVLELFAGIGDPRSQLGKVLRNRFELLARFVVEAGLKIKSRNGETMIGILEVADFPDDGAKLGWVERRGRQAVVPLVIEPCDRDVVRIDFGDSNHDVDRIVCGRELVSAVSELVKGPGFDYLSSSHSRARLALADRERLESTEIVALFEASDLLLGDKDPLVAVIDHDERQTERLVLANLQSLRGQRLQTSRPASEAQSIL